MAKNQSYIYADMGIITRSHWEMFGSAVVAEDYIRLTSDRQGISGAIWNKVVRKYACMSLFAVS